jgi:hypothetical protein
MTAISVVLCSRTVEDRPRSFAFAWGAPLLMTGLNTLTPSPVTP